MRKSFIAILIVALMVGTAIPIAAQISKVGTSGAQFLKIGVGARAAGMGFAFTALANDVTGLYWNPAAIAWLNKNEFNASYTSWFADIHHYFIGATIPVSSTSCIGVHTLGVTMGEMEETTLAEPEGTGRTFAASDLALGVTYAQKMSDNLSLGVTVKYIHESIWEMNANGIAFDAATYYMPFPTIRLAMSISHFGPDMKFTGGNLIQRVPAANDPQVITNQSLEATPYSLPTTFRIGVAYEPIHTDNILVTTAADGVHYSDNFEQLNVGAEVTLLNTLSLRVGYNYLPEKDVQWLDIERQQQQNLTRKTEFDAGLNLGFGIQYEMGTLKGTFDYAWSKWRYLDNVNRISVGIEF